MIRTALTRSAKKAFLSGQHKIDDRYRIALYDSGAELDGRTEFYSLAGEVSGAGYQRGGKEITGWRVRMEGDEAVIAFDDVVWEGSISAAGAMIYNDSYRGLPAVATLSFGGTVTSTNGEFRVSLPADRVIGIR
jgi:hypothetical protein